MFKKSSTAIVCAAILAVGIFAAGLCIRSAATRIAGDKSTASVRGLCEREVTADKVTWPLVTMSTGNDLQALYDRSQTTNAAIVEFLKKGGITDVEISVNPPLVRDEYVSSYDRSRVTDRYTLTNVIVVTSADVMKVRSLIKGQADLLRAGIAILADSYQYPTTYEFTGLNEIKPQMIAEATRNAREAAAKFASDSGSKIGRILNASQGQFSITDRDAYTPYIKNIRVVTTLTYSIDN